MKPNKIVNELKWLISSSNNHEINKTLIDSEITINVDDIDNIIKQLAEKEVIFVGNSSAANVLAAIEISKTAPKNSNIVTILSDNGSRYLGK